MGYCFYRPLLNLGIWNFASIIRVSSALALPFTKPWQIKETKTISAQGCFWREKSFDAWHPGMTCWVTTIQKYSVCSLQVCSLQVCSLQVCKSAVCSLQVCSLHVSHTATVTMARARSSINSTKMLQSLQNCRQRTCRWSSFLFVTSKVPRFIVVERSETYDWQEIRIPAQRSLNGHLAYAPSWQFALLREWPRYLAYPTVRGTLRRIWPEMAGKQSDPPRRNRTTSSEPFTS